MAKLSVQPIGNFYQALLAFNDDKEVLALHHGSTPEEAREALMRHILIYGKENADKYESYAKHWREAYEALRLEHPEV